MFDHLLYLLENVEEDYDFAQELQNSSQYYDIEYDLQDRLPLDHPTFYFFGSRSMGICSHGSDLDIFIGFGKSKNNKKYLVIKRK
jgi:hypothetical protein